ncbi:nuclear factor 7, ovary [Procambarus clarkii]|uniref:nuclear factor 7, ovary n=1 Tax=Procambarus clarkii TaxID=6728 RepID=UPI003744A0B2
MMEMNELTCPLCDERYTDARTPRNLGCGHTYCTFCVQQVIAKDRRCPECRLIFSCAGATDLPVNYPLLRMARGFLPSASQSASSSSAVPPLSGREMDAGQCRAHEAIMYFWCDTCRKFVCRDCLVLDHNAVPLGNCRILSITQAIEKIKITQLEKSTTKGQSLRDFKDSINNFISKLDGKKEKCEETQEKLRQKLQEEADKAQVIEIEKNEAFEKLTEIDKLLESLNQKESALLGANTVQEISEEVQASGEVLDVAEMFQTHERQRQVHSISTILNYGRQCLVVELGQEEVYAAREELGCPRRWARVSLHQHKAHLHDLRDTPPPPHAITIPWECVRNLVSEDSATVFLEVAVDGEPRGRIYLTMFGNTPRGRQFVYLCSGERNHSYRNNKSLGVFRLDKPGEFISIEGCKNADGTPASALVDGITSGGLHTRPIVLGLLSGPPLAHTHQTLFNICLQEKPNKSDLSGFGRVVGGMEILRSVSRHVPASGVTVRDCGLVIPL